MEFLKHMTPDSIRKMFIEECENGNLETVKILANRDVDLQEGFYRVSENGYLSVVEYLVGLPGVDPAAQSNWAIQYASEKGHLPVVDYLVGLPGVDPTSQDNYAIRWASANGHLSVVEYLAGLSGVDPAAKNNEAIRFASMNGHFPVVKYLAGLPGVDPAAENNWAICLASANGHLPVVKFLKGLNPKNKLIELINSGFRNPEDFTEFVQLAVQYRDQSSQ